VGGIMVLFLFVIMLVNLDDAMREKQFRRRWWIPLLATGLVGLEIAWFLGKGLGSIRLAPPAEPPPMGNTEQIATSLFSQYLLPFELASILLLVAIVGSVVMAKKRI
jgi:NADH-quinone oxidoreductase subunit J